MSENRRAQKAPKGEPMRFIRETAVPYASDDCLTWPYTRPDKTYGSVRVGKVKRGAHRVVCEIAHGAPPTPRHHAAHTCGNGKAGCVNARHLQWKTPSENQMDKHAHGTMAHGERNGGAKLSHDQVAELIRTRPGERVAADTYGISKTQYFAILRRDTWRHVNV